MDQSTSFFTPIHLLEDWITEDAPYGDLTTGLLGIGDRKGIAEMYTREECIVSATEEASKMYQLVGCEVTFFKKSGEEANTGEVILRAYGNAASLHIAWRTAQTLVSLASGVATKTAKLVRLAKSVNPNIVISTTRKAPPGIKRVYFKSVLAGGGQIHRYGLSDSILVFKNHINFFKDLDETISKLKEIKKLQPERVVGIEVERFEDAIKAAEAKIDFIQLEKMEPDIVRKAVETIRRVHPRIIIAAAGGIDEHNVKEYAKSGIDLIVTSAPYSANPIDIGTRITALGF